MPKDPHALYVIVLMVASIVGVDAYVVLSLMTYVTSSLHVALGGGR